MIDLLFVYGTLRSGYGRHGVLRRLGAQYVGVGTVQGELFNLGAYPGALKSESVLPRIAGEIYRLRPAVRAFKVLDQVEGIRLMDPASGLLKRETTDVAFQDGRRAATWIYWLNRVPWLATRIPSGDYTRL